MLNECISEREAERKGTREASSSLRLKTKPTSVSLVCRASTQVRRFPDP
jgi:hypothetical protein